MKEIKHTEAVVVNDDPVQLRRISALLEKDGLKVVSYSSPEEAFEKMNVNNPPDIIITDLHMPGIDGWRFCRLLRSNEYKHFNIVPIIVVSATFSGDYIQHLTTELGANAFIASPFEPSVLRAQVRALLEGKTFRLSPKVLIVEDSKTLIKILSKVFEEHGYVVYTALTGEEGKRMFKDINPNIVILDYHLPDIKGDCLIKYFKHSESLAVVIMITSDPTPELATRFMKMGADGYVRKPFDVEYLITLCEMTSRERSLLRVEDILEERTRELQYSEERFHSLFEVIPDVVIIYDEQGFILHINEAGARCLERSKNDLIGLHLSKIVTRDSVAHININIQRTITEGLSRFETSYLTKTGHIIESEISGKLIQFGDKSAIMHVSRDITERKRAQEVLLKNEELYRNLVENIDIGVNLIDSDHNIVMLNTAQSRMMNKPVSDIIGKKCFREFEKRDEVCPHCPGVRAMANDHKEEVESGGIRDDGSHYLVRIQAFPVYNSDGTVRGFIEVIEDIAKRKQMESQLIQAQKMESIGRLAGGIAHDFNNMLTVILGYSEMTLNELFPDNPIYSNIQEIAKTAQRATNLTRQLLAFSRRQIIEPKIINLNELLLDMHKMLRRLIGEDIELVTLLSEDLWPLRVDTSQVEQVLSNLVINARDAMSEGGKLIIETANVTLDDEYVQNHVCSVPGDYVMMAVTDNGHGMDEKTMLHIFEPFFTTKDCGKGTGLGLSTCYGIVKQNGGNIWVYSEPDQGTTFKIYLPRADGEPLSLSTREEFGHLSDGTETVLFVEDEPSLREMAVHVLRDKGYTVLEASNGEEAIRIAKKYIPQKIHILVTDVVMPLMGGKELSKQLKKICPDIKVLCMSGYTDNSIVHHGVLDPGFEFLQKPFSPNALAFKLLQVLNK